MRLHLGDGYGLVPVDQGAFGQEPAEKFAELPAGQFVHIVLGGRPRTCPSDIGWSDDTQRHTRPLHGTQDGGLTRKVIELDQRELGANARASVEARANAPQLRHPVVGGHLHVHSTDPHMNHVAGPGGGMDLIHSGFDQPPVGVDAVDGVADVHVLDGHPSALDGQHVPVGDTRSRTTWVAGSPYAQGHVGQGESVGGGAVQALGFHRVLHAAPQPGEHVEVLLLPRELGRLVEADELHLTRLVPVVGVDAVHVSELQRRPGREGPPVLVAVPVGVRVQPVVGHVDQAVLQFQVGDGAAEDHRVVARNVRELQGTHEQADAVVGDEMRAADPVQTPVVVDLDALHRFGVDFHDGPYLAVLRRPRAVPRNRPACRYRHGITFGSEQSRQF